MLLAAAAGGYRTMGLLRRHGLIFCQDAVLHGDVHLHGPYGNRDVAPIDGRDFAILAQRLYEDASAHGRIAARQALAFRHGTAGQGKVLVQRLAGHFR